MANRKKNELRIKKKCNCHLHEKQVCNICQGVTGKEKDYKFSNKRI